MTILLVIDGAEVPFGRVDARTPDLALVELLLRMRLAAGRRGATVRLRDAPAALRGLLELAGVGELLGVEPRGQPEVGELLGIDEVVQSRDPPG